VIIAVISGGIAMVFSAILLKKKAEKVFLIERKADIGDLYRSFQKSSGIFFDYGSRFLREPGLSDLVEILNCPREFGERLGEGVSDMFKAAVPIVDGAKPYIEAPLAHLESGKTVRWLRVLAWKREDDVS
jgi:hypothetical protein